MDDQFDKWIRDSVPIVKEDRVRQEVQLAILKERMRSRQVQGRRRVFRWGLIGVPVLFLALLVGDVVELGGDSFDLVEVETKHPGRLFRNESGTSHVVTLGNESEEDIYETAQQLAANEGVLVEAEGWEVRDNLLWLLSRSYMVNGKEKIFTANSQNPLTRPDKNLVQFFHNGQNGFLEKVSDGRLTPTDQFSIVLDGVDCQGEVYESVDPEFGLVKYYKGAPSKNMSSAKGGEVGPHGRVFKNEFRGGGFNVYEDQTDEEIHEFNQQIAAGEGLVVGMLGWVIQGHSDWGVIRDYFVFGKKFSTSSLMKTPRSMADLKWFVERLDDWKRLIAIADSGEIQPDGTEIIELDEIKFLARRYSIPTEKYGVATYYEGEPLISVFPEGSTSIEQMSFGNVKAMFR